MRTIWEQHKTKETDQQRRIRELKVQNRPIVCRYMCIYKYINSYMKEVVFQITEEIIHYLLRKLA